MQTPMRSLLHLMTGSCKNLQIQKLALTLIKHKQSGVLCHFFWMRLNQNGPNIETCVTLVAGPSWCA